MRLSTCELTMLLRMAKAAHSKLPKAVTDDPHHSWEEWYAAWMMDRLKEVDYESSSAFKRGKPDGRPDFGLAPSCPPGPRQECEDALLYGGGPAADEQASRLEPFDPASPPSPASGWR